MQSWDVVTAAAEETANAKGQLAAIDRVQAVIEFELDGTVRTANANFLSALGYSLAEIQGKHHSMFVDHIERSGHAYREFWAQLNRGEFVAGEFKRIAKGGGEVWIQASYNPILDAQGKPYKVVKYATDITEAKVKAADFSGQIAAIGRSQAVIEFELNGTIRTANENFLSVLGYRLSDIQGRHHSMFVDVTERASPDYQEFWARLGRGEFVAGEFKRIGSGGKEVWIQASYNPIMDASGRPFKVVKYASDITKQVESRFLMNQVLKGVAANAVTLTSSSEELSAVSQQMSANAEETAVQANTVSAAAEQVSRNVQTVAAGTEEMSVSIREIAKNAAEAARVASSAVSVAASTNVMVAKLGESSDEIGKVIKVITSIAQQTKLLALNATIEAARAGEAGKGFAVVANEVKELAKETAKATEDISLKISAIQSDTTGAVAAIGQISNIINQINDIQNTIASAVEEQTATTNEMSRNVAESAKGVDEIAKNVTGVAKAAQDTTAGAASSLQAARSLSGMAVDLEKLVGQFNGKS
ncbi:MAG: PAS domain-containing methyl-accepting chemotaxis protein [Polyangiaceae bacterium]|nr:PAS domain-containing methyl-accepting chemotaxis protein [Polyangiaceae bacterium]